MLFYNFIGSSQHLEQTQGIRLMLQEPFPLYRHDNIGSTLASSYSWEYLLLTVVVLAPGEAWMRAFSLSTVGSISSTV